MITPSRALGDGKGDPQAKAELLGKLLLAAGEKPYMLRHGTGRTAQFLTMVTVSDAEAESLADLTGKKPTVITFGKMSLMPLQLDSGSVAGQVSGKLYDPAKSRWTSTIALTRAK